MKGRPPTAERTFTSKLVEDKLQAILLQIKDPQVAAVFSQCWLSTLDTTVFAHDGDLKEKDHSKARPTTWIITGDIPASWLRDSASQVSAYLPLLSTPSTSSHDWTALYRLILGTVYTQASCILLHPFSNAFIPPTSTVKSDNSDRVHPPPPLEVEEEDTVNKGKKKHPKPRTPPHIRVWESKYELDSLASFLSLSASLMRSSHRVDPLYNSSWREAVRLVIRVCRLQQRGTDEEAELLGAPWLGPKRPKKDEEEEEVGEWSWKGEGRYEGRDGVYRFERETQAGSETRSLGGLGEPARRCGLIKSAFRPSDDATVLPFLIPSNAFLSVGALSLAEIIDEALDSSGEELEAEAVKELRTMSVELSELGEEVKEAVWREGVVSVRNEERIEEKVFAYEVDGFGSHLIADDANLPSLLSLPFLGFLPSSDSTYVATRKLVLSSRNKWFFKGKMGEGVGGMHIGEGFVWPMSIITRALTSDDDEEILDCLSTLKSTTAGTGFMHESFHVSDAKNFTRSWFAWANGLMGQLVLKLAEERPDLLR
ncbi:hypothetical protein BCR35DRAFT_287273 [Leucosporidium creatinivorum]|uniref:Glycoside hydrolase family 125 protein n=1 Tax=Leucosporidium creatinivorum TaxID=106004 RepID=A0A1Y2G4A8_9BASI|nr:hypothetical protein BCR35DRAFT_287273 [Leucosporidium creatinivorum]